MVVVVVVGAFPSHLSRDNARLPKTMRWSDNQHKGLKDTISNVSLCLALLCFLTKTARHLGGYLSSTVLLELGPCYTSCVTCEFGRLLTKFHAFPFLHYQVLLGSFLALLFFNPSCAMCGVDCSIGKDTYTLDSLEQKWVFQYGFLEEEFFFFSETL